MQQAPLWVPHEHATSSKGVWLFSRYEDAVQIFSYTSGISKNLEAICENKAKSVFDQHLLNRDGDAHLRLRRLIAQYFSLKTIKSFTPVMTEVAQNLLTPLKEANRFDFVKEFAEPMPLHIIARLVGIPFADMEKIRAWSVLLGDGFDSLLTTPLILGQQQRALDEFMSYIITLIDSKTVDETCLLAYLHSAYLGAGLNREELAGMLGFLLFAGHETTISLISSSLLLLLSDKKQWPYLRSSRNLLLAAIEETLRFESPEQRTSFRITTEVLHINGTIIEPGQQLGIIIGSANRDASVFKEANRFNIFRNDNPHLAFGYGLHNCLGKSLARAEAEVALSKILLYLPDLHLAEQPYVWRKNSFFRSLQSLPVQNQPDKRPQ